MKTGVELIADERKEQVEKHGFTAKGDAQHKHGELKSAAIYLLDGASGKYPSNWSAAIKHRFDAKSEIGKLKVAAALIAAEIDRLQVGN
jgi:hypothetical protein